MTRIGRLSVRSIGIIVMLLFAVAARADLPVPLIVRADADLENLRLMEILGFFAYGAGFLGGIFVAGIGP